MSTTVVEVGVNVPNATVMMVENAERFGLAQLHQLRGRVGRGEYQSYCIFIQGSDEETTSKRLDILNKSNDGFYIAGERSEAALDLVISLAFARAAIWNSESEISTTILQS